jgi:hypothetical protein
MKRRTAGQLLGIFAFLGLAAISLAGQKVQQDNSLLLGDVRLRLGMAEGTARRQLEVHHTITEGGFVITKDGPPFERVGSVSFKDGRFVWATKDWDQRLDQVASVDVIRRLIALVAGKTGCVTGTASIEEPTFRSSTLVIRCPSNRQVEASVSEAPGSSGPSVSLRESYGTP